MEDILQKIIIAKKDFVAASKRRVSLATIRAEAEAQEPAKNFGEALLARSPADSARVIAECKCRSPSKGVLRQDYDPVELAIQYEQGGAAAISVLTDTPFFGGDLDHLRSVVEVTNIPVLRKDFIIDEYQIYEARAYGADSFLLLSGVLDSAQLQYFTEIGREFGMEPLVESHSAEELRAALKTDCLIMGINNRNLKSFEISFEEAGALAKIVRSQEEPRILVCESGIKCADDIVQMRALGYNAFLVGEALVTLEDPQAGLEGLLNSRPIVM